jgi:hypothetical protein
LKIKTAEVAPAEIKEKPKEEKTKPAKSIFKQSKNPNFRFGKPELENDIEILENEDENRNSIDTSAIIEKPAPVIEIKENPKPIQKQKEIPFKMMVEEP